MNVLPTCTFRLAKGWAIESEPDWPAFLFRDPDGGYVLLNADHLAFAGPDFARPHGARKGFHTVPYSVVPSLSAHSFNRDQTRLAGPAATLHLVRGRQPAPNHPDSVARPRQPRRALQEKAATIPFHASPGRRSAQAA